jgi:flagellar hook-associated protein 1
MGNLFGSLLSTSGAMRVFEQGLNTTQNNVVNVNTPGYARQRMLFEAKRFEPDRNIMGGVGSVGLYNYRDAYSERNVQQRSSLAYYEQQRSDSISSIESLFPITAGSGIPAAMNRFFDAFSQLTVSPNDTASRQVVLDRASDVAFNFRRSTNQLMEERGNTQVSIASTVSKINQIAKNIQDINASRRGNSAAANDPGSEARLYSNLEELSQYVDFTAIQAQDGSMSVYLGGQSLLVIGNRDYPISTDIFEDKARILNSDGIDITASLKGGKLMGNVDVYNNKLPNYINGLNNLAASFSDNVNATLAMGLDQNGNAPLQDLFYYDGSQGAAYTVQVNGITTDQLALAAPGSPGGNANAIKMVQLAKEQVVNNQTFSQYFGTLAGAVGRDLAGAKAAAGTQQDLLAQAKELRSTLQDVSLDEEATQLIMIQRAYQASSQMFRTINEMTDTVINTMLR